MGSNRVSDRMLFEVTNRSISQNFTKLQLTQSRLAAGKKLLKLSDNAYGASVASYSQAGLQQLRAMESSANMSRVSILASSSALQQLLPILSRATELAVNAANGSLSAGDMSDIGKEMTGLHDAVQSIANINLQNRYLFSGNLSSTPPFAADGTYVGDSGVRKVEIAPGLQVAVNVPGNEVFNVTGGQNILKVLQNIATGMMSYEQSTILQNLPLLQQCIDQVTQASASLGTSLKTLEDAAAFRQSNEDSLLGQQSSALEDDATQLISDTLLAQAAYEASLSEAVRIIQSMGSNNALRR